MALYLVITAGPDKGRQFAIEEAEQLLIGRGEAAQVQLNDRHVSRKHCEARVMEGAVHLTDLSSATGTWVNGNRIDECRLTPGDRIRLGESEIRLQLDDPTYSGTLYLESVAQSALDGDHC